MKSDKIKYLFIFGFLCIGYCCKMFVVILKKKMIICLCLVEFNVILRFEWKNKWWSFVFM